MTVEEIFSAAGAHMVAGLMLHSQMSDYYGFLGLKGYQKCHKYHYFSENANYKSLGEYYLTHYNKIIIDTRVDDPGIIPESWFKYSRQDVNVTTRKNAIQTGMERWVQWERDTKHLYEQFYQELISLREISSAYKMAEYIQDVSEELAQAEQKYLELKAMDYDISVIIDNQEDIYKKYKKKLKEIKL